MARHEDQEDARMDRETASEMNVDDLVSQLLDMGFEMSDCRDALAVGKFNIEDAVEWLLKARPSLTSQGPTLRLQQHSSSQFDSGGWLTPLDSASSVENSTSSLAVGGSSEQVAESESEVKVSSRLAEASISKGHFEDRMKREIEQLARQERMEKRKAREVVLLQIAQDKAEKRGSANSVTNLQFGVETASLSSTSSHSIKPATSNEQNESRLECLLQIRCPDGQTLKQNFSQAETLANVWDFLHSQLVLCNTMMLMQPFPKREFTMEDKSKTLKELKLVPSSNLILKQSNPVVQLQGMPSSCPSDIQSTGETAERVEPLHNWGRGVQLDTTESGMFIPISSNTDSDSMDTVDDVAGHPAVEPAALNPIADSLLAQLHMWGTGSRLGRTEESGRESEEISRVAEQAGAAARSRAQVAPSTTEEHSESMLVQYPVVPTLSEQCLKLVVRRLQEPQPTLSLALPSHIAERILQHMMKEKVLRPLLVQHFRTCRIQRLNFDYYPYATNELLQAFRYHTSLQQISLVSCPLIGDGGLQKLKSLKRLQLLNLRGCPQITDNCFAVVSEYPCLHTLNLEGTKITDEGLQKFLSVPRPSLQRLSLGRTNVSHHCLPYFKNFPNLIFLSLDGTKVATLTSLPAFPSLESFSIQGTDIPTQDLAYLHNFPKLTSLNIGDTPNVNGDEGLRLLSGLHLSMLQFPSHVTTTDAGLQHITGLPLSSIDLTNYICVGDTGIVQLAVMKSLRQLHLSNTKLTDSGLLALKDLTALEVLYVDRTAVTDAGAAVLESFVKLQELSMASTRIKGRFISAGILNHCKLLTKLNLSRTRITTKVLKSLVLPNLVLLNVDGTRLTIDPTGTLTGCTRLRHVSAKNLRPPRTLNDSDSE